MFDLSAYLWALPALWLVALAGWWHSLRQHNVNIVDTLWSLLFLLAALVYVAAVDNPGPRTGLLLALLSIWALRLSGYLAWRNHGKPEDWRYAEMREHHGERFPKVSLYTVFLLQGAIAWVVSLPLLAAINGQQPMGWLDTLGVLLWTTGMIFEAGGDWQLTRFKAKPENKGKVLNSGLWRYTRHPNYFGDFCVWWGFFLLALSAGGWWSVIGPLIMSVLLMKVSGVTLTEKTIEERRPAYREYKQNTSAFFPAPPRA